MICSRCEQFERQGGCLTHRLQRGEARFQTPADLIYNFVDVHVTGKPVQISGRRQWRRFLKENGSTDNVSWSAKSLKSPKAAPFSPDVRRQVEKAVGEGIRRVKQRPNHVLGRRSFTESELKRDMQAYRQSKLRKEQAA